jgi:hypothetical protein
MKMTPISCEDAREQHGITCEHSRAENGELRFRLLKNDGTAYIRTEAPPHGGWQDSHWHYKVLETYIVQDGWIGYAELRNGTMNLRTCQAGEAFTTVPEVIHNVYLPKEAVIHTVKHGNSLGEKRLEDERTKAFTEKTRQISEATLLSTAANSLVGKKIDRLNTTSSDYSDAYKHFDILIWQVPVWASAIFTVAILGTPTFETHTVQSLGVPVKILMSYFYGLVGVSLASFSYALFRFRSHHIKSKSYTPSGKNISPQVGLQLVVNLQASALVFAAFLVQGYPPASVLFWGLLIVAMVTVAGERKLSIESTAGGDPTDTRS